MIKKDYYKEYYKNNKTDILNRVKNNYYKKVNKTIEKKEEFFTNIRKYVDHIIVLFLIFYAK